MKKKDILLLFLFLFSGIVSIAQITSNFTSSDEGWTVSDLSDANPVTVVHQPAGGNPGGFVSVSLTSSLYYYWKAPAKFFGGHCLDSYGMNLKFDLQLSAPGTITNASTVYGNIRITSGATTIVTNVSTVPAVTPGWTSYTVALDETTVWHISNTTGPLATHEQIITALSNINKLEIVAQAAFGSDPDVSIDNVILEQRTLGTPPSITSFTPQSGIPSSTNVTIAGNNFSTTLSNNIVYFGGVIANVTSASATQLIVKVPEGAAYAPIVAYNKATGLSGSSIIPFQPRFDNNKDYGGQIIRATMAPAVSFDLDGTGTNAVGDIDGDGLNDIVTGEGGGGLGGIHQFSVFKNAGISSTISTASFLPKVTFVLTLPYVKAFTTLADFDGDGKLDVAISSASAVQSYVTVFRNTSTPGSISFAPEQNYSGYSYSDGPITTADMDGDGRPEILCVFNNNCAVGDRLYIYPNRSTPGNIDFCGFRTFGNIYTCGGHLTVGDLDGDKLPDVVVDAGRLAVFRNTSTPGNITMATPFELTTTAGGRPVLADLDNDGKTDLAWPYGFYNVEIRKNIYSGGAFDVSSFSPAILITTTVYTASEIVAGDINGDGKLDLVMSSSNDLGVSENVTAAGTLNTNSFLPTIPYAVNNGTAYPIDPLFADFDGDHKQDIVIRTSNTTPKKLLVFHNESFPAPRIDNLSPSSGISGSSVNLTGDNFRTGFSPSVVGRIGNSLSTITPSSNISATATIPANAISGRISLTEHGLTAFSKPFSVTFGTNKVIDATSFSNGIDFTLATNTRDAIGLADLDDDGKIDVLAIENYNDVRIYKNTQATAGQAITTSSLSLEATKYTGSYNLIPFDIDGDGRNDLNSGYGLFKNNSTPGSISFSNGSTGAYTYAAGFNFVASSDFNKDGKTDLAVTNGTAFVQLYQNESTTEPFVNNVNFSTFNINAVNLVKPSNYGGIVAVDFDGDGYEDIATASPNTDNFTVYQNLKVYGPITTASFSAGTTITSADGPNGLTVDDFDGDGKIDLAITFYNTAFVSVYRNTSTIGSISFAANIDLPCTNKGYNIASQDLDGDGKSEIVVIHRPNPGPGSFSVLQNKSTSGNISFNSAVNYPLSTPARNPQALAIADMNQDQKPDILIVADPWGVGTNALMVFENKVQVATITITTQPSDFIACAGINATFNAAAIGTTNIVYQWQFSIDGVFFTDLNNGGGYSGATTGTLTINTTGNFGIGRYRCKISGDAASSVFTNDEGLFLSSVPSSPSATGASSCSASSVMLSASGGSSGQYRWYDVATGGTADASQKNSTFNTPVISTTTTYFVSLNNGSCEGSRTPVIATISLLAKPVLQSSSPVISGVINICVGDVLTLTAPSGFVTYTWSNGATTNPITITTSTSSLTVQVKDGSGCTSPLSDAINIVVNPYPTAIITVNGTQLTASAGDSYQWYQNGDPVAGATSQSFEFNLLEYGLYKVDITDNGCTSTSTEFEYLITGNEKFSDGLKVFPNPVNDELFVEFNPPYTIRLIDGMGNILKSSESKSKSTKLPFASVVSGTYFIQIKNENQTHYIRIIKN